jgi:hypothetical protein
MMGNFDDEFKKLVENTNLDDLQEVEAERQVAFTVQFLMESVADVSRTLALLTELLQVVMEHHLMQNPAEPPGLTKEQLDYLTVLFDQSRRFNQSVIDAQEYGDD